MSAIPSITLGLLCLVGGTMGYLKKGSSASLYAGSVFGLLLMTCGVTIMSKKRYIGNTMASLSSALLSIAMAHRFSLSGKVMPSGMVAIVAILSFVYHTVQAMKAKMVITSAGKEITCLRWWQGFFIASIFSAVYLLTPMYLFSAIVMVALHYPTKDISYIYASPIIVSLMFPSTPMNFLAHYMTPMLDYFAYEEVVEISDEDLLKMANGGKNFISAMQPHGVVSFCSLCHWVKLHPEVRPIKTAAASALLKIPILKHVMGIFGLTPASGSNVKKILSSRKGIGSSLVLYCGGIAELFKTSTEEERLYIKNRKGFVKVALRENADIIPVYLFGNTSVLTVYQNRILESLSRKLQMSLTYFWGKWFLPFPRDEKVLYVRGKPLGLPHIPEPTDEDVEKWHAKYCEEVKRIFDSNKEKVPAYKHKTLHFD